MPLPFPPPKTNGTRFPFTATELVIEKPEWHRVSDNIKSFDDGYWTHFARSGNLPRPYREMIEALKITGKYLFFSENRETLVKIVIDELENNGFREAKVNDVGTNIGPDYVLCLYFRDNGRSTELTEKYSQYPGVRYRYWKSDDDTKKGKYSAEFLSSLSAEQRREFLGQG